MLLFGIENTRFWTDIGHWEVIAELRLLDGGSTSILLRQKRMEGAAIGFE
jgi:hypothetical protein